MAPASKSTPSSGSGSGKSSPSGSSPSGSTSAGSTPGGKKGDGKKGSNKDDKKQEEEKVDLSNVVPPAPLMDPGLRNQFRGLDKERLLRIEKTANEILMEQENLRNLQKQSASNREALGAFRRKEVGGPGGEKECWLQMGFREQFISFPVGEAKKKLDQTQVRLDKEVSETVRPKLKSKLQELHGLNPHVTEIAPGVLDLLCKERASERNKEEEKARAAREAKATAPVGNNNRLDYSRFDHLDTDSESD